MGDTKGHTQNTHRHGCGITPAGTGTDRLQRCASDGARCGTLELRLGVSSGYVNGFWGLGLKAPARVWDGVPAGFGAGPGGVAGSCDAASTAAPAPVASDAKATAKVEDSKADVTSAILMPRVQRGHAMTT